FSEQLHGSRFRFHSEVLQCGLASVGGERLIVKKRLGFLTRVAADFIDGARRFLRKIEIPGYVICAEIVRILTHLVVRVSLFPQRLFQRVLKFFLVLRIRLLSGIKVSSELFFNLENLAELFLSRFESCAADRE